MSKLFERKMYQLLLERHHKHIVMTEQKAERTKSVIEQILSRHYGRNIKITEYRLSDY